MDIVQFVKTGRIEWLGHVHCMPLDRVPHWLPNDASDMGKRRTGRPRTPCIQVVEMDLRRPCVAWGQKAADRTEWRKPVSEAKAHLRQVSTRPLVRSCLLCVFQVKRLCEILNNSCIEKLEANNYRREYSYFK